MANSILSVSQLNLYVKSQIESDANLQSLFVKGEIFSFHKHFKSGHLYFSLKDETASIKVVMFASSATKLGFMPEDGMSVLVKGNLSVYERDGVYQLYAKDMIPDGVGARQIALEQLKNKLTQEGLFDHAHKKTLPAYPQNIAIITSKSGAAIKDVASVASRRYPLAKLYLFPVSVQGDLAKPSILWAFDKMQSVDIPFDVCILTRGGGSQEDLWVFNDEQIVRKIFQSNIPLVSAIGHEIDTTLCDFVADMRAPTPSAAAELVTPDIMELESSLLGSKNLVFRRLSAQMDKLAFQIKNSTHRANAAGPQMKLERCQNKLDGLKMTADNLFTHSFVEFQSQLDKCALRLDGANPLTVMNKGFAKVTHQGTAVLKTEQIQVGDHLKISLTDGQIDCLTTEIVKDIKR